MTEAGPSPRSRARYQLYADGQRAFWRLLGGNNWSFGRSAIMYASLAEATAAAHLVMAVAGEGTFEMTSDVGRAWNWTLVSGGVAIARSEARYGRRVECLTSISRFRTMAPAGEIPEHVMPIRARLGEPPAGAQAVSR